MKCYMVTFIDDFPKNIFMVYAININDLKRIADKLALGSKYSFFQQS